MRQGGSTLGNMTTGAIMGAICVDTAVSKWAGEDDWMKNPVGDSQPTRTNHHRL